MVRYPLREYVLTDYKVVTLSYTEQASLVIKAKTNEEAEEVIWDVFSDTAPDLQILSIEECPEHIVADLKQQGTQEELDFNTEVKTIN